MPSTADSTTEFTWVAVACEPQCVHHSVVQVSLRLEDAAMVRLAWKQRGAADERYEPWPANQPLHPSRLRLGQL
jgi:hypothetical protein